MKFSISQTEASQTKKQEEEGFPFAGKGLINRTTKDGGG